MKTDDLKAKGLTQEQIDFVMAENGKDISAAQIKTTEAEKERDSLKEQLKTATDNLKAFEGVDVAELQDKIKSLNADLAAKDADYKKQIEGMQFDSILDKALTDAGARSTKAVRALLNVDELQQSKNREADIKAAIEAVQKDNDFLFSPADEGPSFVGPTGGGGGKGDPLAAVRAAMGLKPNET